MRKIDTELYTFPELSEAAQERAVQEFLENVDFPWNDSYLGSLKAIEEHFSIRVKEWEVDTYRGVSYSCDIEQSSIRGLKLKSFRQDHMPTGFSGDCGFWQEFHRVFKSFGDAKHAIDCGLHSFFVEWRKDMEFYESEDSARQELTDTEAEFTEDGERWQG